MDLITFVMTCLGMIVLHFFLTKNIRKEKEKYEKENYELKEASKFRGYAAKINTIQENSTITGISGDEFQEIKIKKYLGGGAHGKVFQVEIDNKKYALKIFCPNDRVFAFGNTVIIETSKRFKNERLIERLDHHNIIKMHRFFEELKVGEKKSNFLLSQWTSTKKAQTNTSTTKI